MEEELIHVLQKYHQVEIPHCLGFSYTVDLLHTLIAFVASQSVAINWHISVEKEYPDIFIKKQFYSEETFVAEPFPDWDCITFYCSFLLLHQ